MAIEQQEKINFVEELGDEVDWQLDLVDDPQGVEFSQTDEKISNFEQIYKFEDFDNMFADLWLWLNFDKITIWNSIINPQKAIVSILKELFPDDKNIDMEKIYNLSDFDKTYLADKVVSVQRIPDDLKNKKVGFENSSWYWEYFWTYEEVNSLLLSWIPVWSEKLPFEVVKSFSNNLMWARKKQALDVFDSFYKVWDTVPPMFNSRSIATWDLTGTSWIWWEPSLWRWERSYSKNKNKQKNYISFWPLSSDMEVLIKPEWIDPRDWVWWGKISFVLEKNDSKITISWEYTENWFVMENNTNIGDIKVLDDKLIIPKKYSWWDMSVTTESNQYLEWWYDEVNFNLYLKNWEIFGEDTPDYAASSGVFDSGPDFSKGLWKYNLSPEEKFDTESFFNSLLRVEKNTKLRPIPVDVTIGADKTIFTDPEKYISENKDYKKNFNWLIRSKIDFPKQPERWTQASLEKYNDGISKWKEKERIYLEKFDGLLDDFMKTVDVSDFAINRNDKSLQQNAQELLIKNRFLSFLSNAIQNDRVFNSIVEWKYDIKPKYVFGKRNIWFETSLSYIKE